MALLTDARLRALKPRPKLYRVADMGGLCIEIRPTGARLWRYRYRHAGKANMVGLGEYPAMSLQEARRERDRQKDLLDAGTDPSAARRQPQASAKEGRDDSFELVAREWLAKQEKWSKATMDKAVALMETWAFPFIGDKPLHAITPRDILAVMRRPEAANKVETAQRLKQRCSKVFCYGIPTGRCDSDPTWGLNGVLKTKKVKSRASLKTKPEVAGLIKAIDGYHGSFITTCALKLSMLTWVRPGELRHWEWSEISDDGTERRIPGEKMKMGITHIVPLSRQAQAVLADLRAMTGHGRFVFPNAHKRDRVMSENTINGALRNLGYSGEEMCAHGFRSTASTLLNEAGYNADWIERQLAHQEQNKVRGAYNYAQYLDDRRQMMQAWADLIDQLRDGAKVVRLRAVG